jgi:hypothetical protein
MGTTVATMASAALHPLMKQTLDTAKGAIKVEASLWDSFAMWAGTDERTGLDEKGLMKAVQAQIELYGASTKHEFDPNACSTYRIYRRLLGTARKFGVGVVIAEEEDGRTLYKARSVGDVRKDVQDKRKEVADAEKEANGEASDGATEVETNGKKFDELPPLEQVMAAAMLIRSAFAKLQGDDAEKARELIGQLAEDVGAIEKSHS